MQKLPYYFITIYCRKTISLGNLAENQQKCIALYCDAAILHSHAYIHFTHLHGYSPGGDDLRGAALRDAGPVTAGLQQRQLICRQSHDLDQAVLGGRLASYATAPWMRATAVRGDVEEQYGVHAVLLQLGRHVLAVAL